MIRIIINEFKRESIYKVKIFTNILESILDLLVYYYVWKAIYSGQDIISGVTYKEIITYIILARILYMLFAWGTNIQISSLIQKGDIIINLIKPITFIKYQFLVRVGNFIWVFVFCVVPMIITGIFLGLTVPYSIIHFLVFLTSIVLALIIAFLIEFLIAIVSFYTVSSWGIHLFKQAVMAFFSGALIPISFMPEALKVLIKILPFRGMVEIPVSIYMGNINIVEILIQIFWCAILYLIVLLTYKICVKKVTIAGG